jgi:hypothetical protein
LFDSMVLNRWRANNRIEKATETTWRKLWSSLGATDFSPEKTAVATVVFCMSIPRHWMSFFIFRLRLLVRHRMPFFWRCSLPPDCIRHSSFILSDAIRVFFHSITNSHKKISSLNYLHRKTCICQIFLVPLQPQSCKCFCTPTDGVISVTYWYINSVYCALFLATLNLVNSKTFRQGMATMNVCQCMHIHSSYMGELYLYMAGFWLLSYGIGLPEPSVAG